MSDTSNNLFKQLDDALRDYEYYEETTTSKPVSGTVSFTDPVTTLVNETNRLMLELDSKYKAAAAEVKKEGVMPRAYWFDSYSEKAKLWSLTALIHVLDINWECIKRLYTSFYYSNPPGSLKNRGEDTAESSSTVGRTPRSLPPPVPCPKNIRSQTCVERKLYK